MSPAGIADLARLTVGDTTVAGFDPKTFEYTVASTGSAWPELHAVAVDEDATVQITQPGAGSETARAAGDTGSVRVTAPDGTEQTYTVTVERTVGVDTPTLAGEPRVGSTVRATATTDPEDAAQTFVWLRDGSPIPDATADAYALTAADEGREISVEVTASAEGFTAGSARSAAIVPAAAPVDPGTGGGDGSGNGNGSGTGGSGSGTGNTGSGSSAGSSSSGSSTSTSTSSSARDLATTGLQSEGIAVLGAGAGLLLLLGGLVLWRRRRGAGSTEG